jgi:alkanesulfonate monooxygenase SsuD/methylene tetrahydromethanopterin reductase-like flavin-dependent oxidoreductase (luciferase family)
MSKPENFTPGNLSPQMTERVLASFDAQAAQVAAGAAVYLSPTQQEALKAFQKQQRAMQEMGLKMSAAMVGGK